MSEDGRSSLSVARERAKAAFEAILAEDSGASVREKAQASRELMALLRAETGERAETPLHHLTRSQLEGLAAQIAKERGVSP